MSSALMSLPSLSGAVEIHSIDDFNPYVKDVGYYLVEIDKQLSESTYEVELNGAVIDNAYTGQVLEEVINVGTTIRKIATSGPYKGIRVIVTPIELDNRIIAAIGVVDIRTMAGINNLIRLRSDDND